MGFRHMVPTKTIGPICDGDIINDIRSTDINHPPGSGFL